MSEDRPSISKTDDLINLQRRWAFRGAWASNPQDFHTTALIQTMGRMGWLDEDHVIIDIGCSSGEPLLTAATNQCSVPRIIGIDPNQASYDALPNHLKDSDFEFITKSGEDTELPSGIADVVLMFDSIYRFKDKIRGLQEARRLLKPDAELLLKTKAERHAPGRYGFERKVGKLVCARYNTGDARIRPPAYGASAKDIPRLATKAGLHITSAVRSATDNYTQITPDRVSDFIADIQSSVTRTQLREKDYGWWYDTVDEYVTPRVHAKIKQHEAKTGEAVFKDPIDEVMFTLRDFSNGDATHVDHRPPPTVGSDRSR